jgi:hypothetical protein
MVRRKVVIISTVTGAVLGIALAAALMSAQWGSVIAYSTDKRVKIYDAQYFTGTNNSYSYSPSLQKLQLGLQRILTKVGVHPAAWWVSPSIFPVPTRGLVICGQFGHDDQNVLSLVSEGPASHPVKGDTIITYGGGVPMRIGDVEILILSPINNGTYHLRRRFQKNDLAIIRIRSQ